MKPVISDAENPWSLTSGVSVRLLSPLGIYPSRMGFRRSDAAIVVQRNLMALITKFRPIVPPEAYYFSEVETLSAFEVRILGAILLCRSRYSGGFATYPTDFEYRTPDYCLDLSVAATLSSLIAKLRDQLKSQECEGIHQSLCASGRQYEINQYATLSRKRFDRLLGGIDVGDHLLIRGLGALIKAGMLSRHDQFIEQACMSLWISLDATFQLFRREMASKGHPDASAIDVGNYLENLLGYLPSGQRYFADFYVERVKTMHPESRFGVYPAAPLCADEYSQLLGSLIPTYEYLITARIPPRVIY
jgi:hypothetical protein